MKCKRMGKVYRREPTEGWWHTHTMAPSAVSTGDGRIRVFLGCWDSTGISRIGYVDVLEDNPLRVVEVADEPVLDIGRDGTFDENGVFPGHANRIGKTTYLFYTGFQLGHKIRHYNFGGLAIAKNGDRQFQRMSQAPILDRSDEGLFVRAGQSIQLGKKAFRSCYSAGSDWALVDGKPRPVYDVFYQESEDGFRYQPEGRRIVSHDPETEYALGRPQLIDINGQSFVFYTRRLRNGRYSMGCALSTDGKFWSRADDMVNMHHEAGDFDSEEMYFPSVVYAPKADRYYLFYSGNGFGREGFGVAELKECRS